AALDDLDLVSVGIGGEEEVRERRSVMLKVTQRTGRQSFQLEATLFGRDIIDHNGQVTVAVAKPIGLRPVEVDRQLEFERRGRMAQIDEGEAVEFEALGQFEPEGAGIEIARARLVEHANHGMNRLGHHFASFKKPMMAALTSGLACL